MGLFQELGGRMKVVSHKEMCWRDDHEQVAYNQRVSRIRKHEYPMLRGVLNLNPPHVSC